jgi:hypothetical protein
LNKVSLIFTRSRNPFKLTSRIISWRIKRPYSHVAIVFFSPWLGIDLVIQASHGMVHIIPLKQMSRSNIVVKKFDLTMDQDQIARGIKWAVNMCGSGYSEMAAIASTFELMRNMGFGQNGDIEFICSEFSARFLEEALGYDLEHMRSSEDYIDPALLEDMLTKMVEIARGY